MIDFENRARIFSITMKAKNENFYFPGMNDGYIRIRRKNIYEDAY